MTQSSGFASVCLVTNSLCGIVSSLSCWACPQPLSYQGIYLENNVSAELVDIILNVNWIHAPDNIQSLNMFMHKWTAFANFNRLWLLWKVITDCGFSKIIHTDYGHFKNPYRLHLLWKAETRNNASYNMHHYRLEPMTMQQLVVIKKMPIETQNIKNTWYKTEWTQNSL